MSLNKFTDSAQYLNIGCKDLKCDSLEIKGAPVSSSSEYVTTFVPVQPTDVSFSPATVIYNLAGDHMKLDVVFTNVIFPTGSETVVFRIPMPSGYKGAGAGLGLVSMAGSCVNTNNGASFNPILSQFTLDNQSITVNLISTAIQTGTFNMSLKISCKVVKV